MSEDKCARSTRRPAAKIRSLAIIGPYPPPYGGVTMHVRRLCRLLDEQGVDYVVYNAGSPAEEGERVVSVFSHRRTWMLQYALFGQEPAVCFLTARPMAWLAGWALAALRGKRVLVRLQNMQMIERWRRSPLHKALARLTLKRMSVVVCVNRELVAAVAGLGVESKKIRMFPGFLPPLPAESDRQTVAPMVWQFATDRYPLIAANGKVAWHDKVDLYGLDHLVELTARLKPDYPQIGTIICLADFRPEDGRYLEELLARAEHLGVAGSLLFKTEPGPFLPVIAIANLFVRPTSTDGDANSIREALCLGVPVVASDVAERPKDVLLYRSRNLDDLVATTRLALTDLTRHSMKKPRLDRQDQERIAAYTDLLATLAEGRALTT